MIESFMYIDDHYPTILNYVVAFSNFDQKTAIAGHI